MEFLIILVILFAVVFIVTGPLRRGAPRARGGEAPASASGAGVSAEVLAQESRRAELEAARAAKYREIRDAELDRDTGKLSDADFQALEARLRADAIEILHELDRLEAPAAQSDPGVG